jgi:hypothetical protein
LPTVPSGLITGRSSRAGLTITGSSERLQDVKHGVVPVPAFGSTRLAALRQAGPYDQTGGSGIDSAPAGALVKPAAAFQGNVSIGRFSIPDEASTESPSEARSRNEITHLVEARLAILTCVNHVLRGLLIHYGSLESGATLGWRVAGRVGRASGQRPRRWVNVGVTLG